MDDDDDHIDDDHGDLHNTGSCHEELHRDICTVDPSRCKDWEPRKALRRDNRENNALQMMSKSFKG